MVYEDLISIVFDEEISMHLVSWETKFFMHIV